MSILTFSQLLDEVIYLNLIKHDHRENECVDEVVVVGAWRCQGSDSRSVHQRLRGLQGLDQRFSLIAAIILVIASLNEDNENLLSLTLKMLPKL